MKRFLLPFLFSICMTAQASQVYNITCEYQFDTLTSDDKISRQFIAYGTDQTEVVVFHSTIKDLPAYFFYEGRYGAYWHEDSSITFSAIFKKKEKQLDYFFQFNNYQRSFSDFSTVFEQTRSLDMRQLFEYNHLKFNFNDGHVVKENINEDLWVNTNHVQISNCQFITY